MPPRISVLLPVYNGERFIAEAVASLLKQTFADFELLVLDDGSTDRTLKILSSFNDPRLQIIRNEDNLQLPRTLNRGLEIARGEFIARMDADDVAFPRRFELQVDYLDTHPLCAVVGSNIVVFDREPSEGTTLMPPPLSAAQIHWELLRVSCLYHPTVLMRRRIFDDERPYDPNYLHCEDYELWLRLSRRYQLANIAQPLLYYRRHAQSISGLHSNRQRENSERALALEIERRIGVRPTRNATRMLMAPRLLNEVATVDEFRAILPLLVAESLAQPNVSAEDRRYIQMSAVATIGRLIARAIRTKPVFLGPLFKLLFFEMHFDLTVYLRFPLHAAKMFRSKRSAVPAATSAHP